MGPEGIRGSAISAVDGGAARPDRGCVAKSVHTLKLVIFATDSEHPWKP
jgi:hypothetical protein